MNLIEKYLTEVTATEIYPEIKDAYPFKGIQTQGDEKKFISKAKRILKKYGVEGWKVDMAIEDFKLDHVGRTIVYIDDISLLRYLVKAGDLKAK